MIKKELSKLNKQEFFTLLKLVYLGNWLANAYRTETLPEYEMKREEYWEKLAELEEEHSREFEKFGLGRLEIKTD